MKAGDLRKLDKRSAWKRKGKADARSIDSQGSWAALSGEPTTRASEGFALELSTEAPANLLISGGGSRVSESDRRWIGKREFLFEGEWLEQHGQVKAQGKGDTPEFQALWADFRKSDAKRVKVGMAASFAEAERE